MWQTDGPLQEAPPPHRTAARGPQAGSVALLPQGPPPAYPTQVKEELEEACFYGQCPPVYSGVEGPGHYGSVYGLQQGRLQGSSSSPPLRGYWSQPGSQSSPVTPLWCHSPLELRSYSSHQPAAFMYPGAAEQQSYASSTPDTPDSGYWDSSLDNSPPLEGPYAPLDDTWSAVTLEGCRDSLVQHAPLPELSLQEILGELDEDWMGGGGLDRLAETD